MELWELAAREHIRDLVAQYALMVDRGRFGDVVDLFAPDAMFELHQRQYHGRDEILSMFEAAASTLRAHQGERGFARHVVGSHRIELLSTDHARSRCYFVALVGSGVDHWGRYLDEFGLIEDRWCFTRRIDLIDGRAPDGWSATESLDRGP